MVRTVVRQLRCDVMIVRNAGEEETEYRESAVNCVLSLFLDVRSVSREP
jgi:hypothetical protein